MTMYRSISSIIEDITRYATRRPDNSQTWIDLTDELKNVIGFWGTVSRAIDPLHTLTTFDNSPFRPGFATPEQLADSIGQIRTLLKCDKLHSNSWFFLRQRFATASNRAQHTDDVDEVVHVLRDFLERENGSSAPIRVIPERADPYSFVQPSRPLDGDQDYERSLYEDFGEDHIGSSVSWNECLMNKWADEWRSSLLSPSDFCKRVGIDELPLSTVSAAILALSPVFQDTYFGWRPGLHFATETLAAFIRDRWKQRVLAPRSLAEPIDAGRVTFEEFVLLE
jgi:hypothetical protein